MRKRILSATLILALALGVVFTAVGCGNSFKDVYKYADTPISVLSSATKVDELEGFAKESAGSQGDLMVLTKTDAGVTTKKVFNVNTGAVVSTMTLNAGDTGAFQIYFVKPLWKSVIMSTYKADGETKTTYKLMDATGAEVVSVTEETAPTFNAAIDLIQVDNVYYRVNADGSVVKAFELNDLSSFDIDEITYKAGGYYYSFYGDALYVYSAENGQLVSYYQLPGYNDAAAGLNEFGILNNGNVFIQFAVKEDNYAEDYDVVIAGNKYTVEQKIVNPKNGDVKDVKDGKNLYVVTGVMAMSGVLVDDTYGEFDEYQGSVKNYAVGFKVDNKQIDDNKEVQFEMTDDGKLDVIDDFVAAQDGTAEKIANGYYLVINKLGQKFLFNAKGENVGEITGMIGCTEKFIRTSKAIYDYNLNKIVDLVSNISEGGYVYVSTVGDSIRLNKKTNDVTEYFLLKDGSAPVLLGNDTDITNISGNNTYITVRSASTSKYTVYNKLGTVLLSDLDVSPTRLIYNYTVSAVVLQVGTSIYYVK